LKLVPSTRFGIAAASVAGGAALAVAGVGGYALASGSLPGQVGQIAGCINTSTHTVDNAYGIPGNLKSCPNGQVPFVLTGGAQGPAGPQGPAGKDAQALPYGIANVQVDGTTWATYSTTIGSPVGDTASGAVRFTCKNATDGCNVSLQAYSTASGYAVYPRIILEKEDNSDGAKLTCEYADGTNNEGGVADLTGSAQTVDLGVGSTFDCGSTVQTGTPADGVDHINVPGASGQGIHYDVFTTLTFTKAS
jgi:hypothetical protein